MHSNGNSMMRGHGDPNSQDLAGALGQAGGNTGQQSAQGATLMVRQLQMMQVRNRSLAASLPVQLFRLCFRPSCVVPLTPRPFERSAVPVLDRSRLAATLALSLVTPVWPRERVVITRGKYL